VAGWALRLLVGHSVQQDSVHVAAGSQLVKPVNRQQRPLATALPRLNNLNRNVLLTLGQLPNLHGQDIKSDGSLILGVFMDNQLGELLLGRLLTG
jgi:hypothetical protein